MQIEKMKLYLDNCCFNRPFDDQTQLKIYLESQAKLNIQSDIKSGKYDLVWSYIMDYEVGKNPFIERKEAILNWRKIATEAVSKESEEILKLAENLITDGIKAYDALHIACAKTAGCDCFLTTDKKLLRVKIPGMKILNPVQFILEKGEE